MRSGSAYSADGRPSIDQRALLRDDLRIAARDGFRVYRVPGFAGCEGLGCHGPLADTALGRLLQSGLVLTGQGGFDNAGVVELTADEAGL